MSESPVVNEVTATPADHRAGFVAVMGRPNVGKSTLVNRLLGQKIAIVSPKPQTTRNRLLGILTLEHAQIILIDTPGIHRPLHRLGGVMVETATATLPDADAVLWLVDVSVNPTEEDRQVAALLSREAARLPVVLGLNKADLVASDQVSGRVEAYRRLAPGAPHVLVSAMRGDGLEALRTALADALPIGPQLYPSDEVTDQQVRFMAGELVREQVLLHLRDEVPHAVAVLVTEFREGEPKQTGETEPAVTYIGATIFVERDTQKSILLGKAGQMIKRIGQAARAEIETLLETRVYLDLWVKVRPKWRADEEELRRLGYASPKKQATKGAKRRQARKSGT